MSYDGVLVAGGTLAIFAVSRWSCIAGEYYFSKRIWVLFLVIGLAAIVFAIQVDNLVGASLLSVLGFCYLWGIGEVVAQEKRVEKGWYPRNPKRRVKEK